MPDLIGHLTHLFLLGNNVFLFDCRFPVKPGMTLLIKLGMKVVDSIRNRLLGDRGGHDRFGLRQQGLAGGDGEGNGLGAGR